MNGTVGEEEKLRGKTDGEWKSLMLTILNILEFILNILEFNLFCLLVVKSLCCQLMELLVYTVST